MRLRTLSFIISDAAPDVVIYLSDRVPIYLLLMYLSGHFSGHYNLIIYMTLSGQARRQARAPTLGRLRSSGEEARGLDGSRNDYT